MKKISLMLIALVLAFMLVGSNAVYVCAGDFDFEAALAERPVDPDNTLQMRIGETCTSGLTPMMSAGGVCYSENEAIVTVDELGYMTAVAPGQTYVAFLDNQMNLRYIQRVEVIDEVYDASVMLGAAVNDYDDINNDDINNDDINNDDINDDENDGSSVNWFLVCILSVVFGIVFSYAIPRIVLSHKTMKRKVLPLQRQGANTVTIPLPDKTYCPKCGEVYGENEFCPRCGTSKKVKSTYVFPINGKIDALELEEMVNEWLAENPFAYDCEIKLETYVSHLNPIVKRKFKVTRAVIAYHVSPQPVNQQYGLAFIYKFRVILGFKGYGTKKQLEKWRKNNPDCKVVSTQGGGYILLIDGQGGILAQYYNYVFFQK